MVSLLGSALDGISSATTTAGSAASYLSRISSPKAGDPDIATDFVTLSESSDGVAIGVKLADTAQEDDKTLLSIVA